MHMRIRRPSPALVISLIALFVALGGTGYAAIKITGKNVKNSSLTGRDIKKNSLTGKQIKESKLGTVPTATSATTATNAGNGIKAYGTIASNGTVIAALSKGITATRVGAGDYCVKAPGVSRTGRNPVATPDFTDGGGVDHTAMFFSAESACSAEGGWRIFTTNAGTKTDIRFSVIIP